MFRELIGTVPQEQSTLKMPERILAENAAAVPHHNENSKVIN